MASFCRQVCIDKEEQTIVVLKELYGEYTDADFGNILPPVVPAPLTQTRPLQTRPRPGTLGCRFVPVHNEAGKRSPLFCACVVTYVVRNRQMLVPCCRCAASKQVQSPGFTFLKIKMLSGKSLRFTSGILFFKCFKSI